MAGTPQQCKPITVGPSHNNTHNYDNTHRVHGQETIKNNKLLVWKVSVTTSVTLQTHSLPCHRIFVVEAFSQGYISGSNFVNQFQIA